MRDVIPRDGRFGLMTLAGLGCLLVLAAASCGKVDRTGQAAARTSSPATGEPARSVPVQEEGEASQFAEPARPLPLVVFLGDSLTAGYGLGEEEAFPAVVEAELATRGRPVRVVNAGVSGDTSAGGRERLSWLLRQTPDVLVVELGANDALRGQPLAATEANLRSIVTTARQHGARVLLVGMQIPPNYGQDYAAGFAALFPRLAEELGVPLVPFLLEGVGGVHELNLPDGIHPTAEGHRRVAATLLPHLFALLEQPPG